MSSEAVYELFGGPVIRKPAVSKKDKEVLPEAGPIAKGNKADDLLAYVKALMDLRDDHPVMQFLSNHKFIREDGVWLQACATYAKILDGVTPSGYWKQDPRDAAELKEALGLTSKDRVPVFLPFNIPQLVAHQNITKSYALNGAKTRLIPSVSVGQEVKMEATVAFMQDEGNRGKIFSFYDFLGRCLGLTYDVKVVPKEVVPVLAALYFSGSIKLSFSPDKISVEVKRFENKRVPLFWSGTQKYFQPGAFDKVVGYAHDMFKGVADMAPLSSHAYVDPMQKFIYVYSKVDVDFKSLLAEIKKQKLTVPPMSSIDEVPEDNSSRLDFYKAAFSQLEKSRDFRAKYPVGDDYTKGFGSALPFQYDTDQAHALAYLYPLTQAVQAGIDKICIFGSGDHIAIAMQAIGLPEFPIYSYGGYKTKYKNVQCTVDPDKSIWDERTLLIDDRDFESGSDPVSFYKNQDARIVTACSSKQSFIVYGKMPDDLGNWVTLPPEESAFKALRDREGFQSAFFPGVRVHNGYGYYCSFFVGEHETDPKLLGQSLIKNALSMLKINVYRDYCMCVGRLEPPALDFLHVLQKEINLVAATIHTDLPKRYEKVKTVAKESTYSKEAAAKRLGKASLPTANVDAMFDDGGQREAKKKRQVKPPAPGSRPGSPDYVDILGIDEETITDEVDEPQEEKREEEEEASSEESPPPKKAGKKKRGKSRTPVPSSGEEEGEIPTKKSVTKKKPKSSEASEFGAVPTSAPRKRGRPPKKH